jgi:hypothetical protein
MKALFIKFPMMMMAQGFHLKDSEDFTLSLITDPRASFKEGGLFIGAEIEYSGAVYTRVGISNFAVLKDGYGVDWRNWRTSSGYFDTVRYYTGIRLGVIKDKQEIPLD